MRILISTLLLILFAIHVFAEKVDEQTARNVAVNWFNETAGEGKYALSSISEVFYETEGEDVLLYIFNFNDDGFIIVPADDNVRPVLGWSNENPYTIGNHPPQFEYFIDLYRAAVLMGDDYEEAGLDAREEWQYLSEKPLNFIPRSKEKSVSPLLTCNWDQCEDWNTYCPYDANAVCWNNRVPVGCVATAMAQIMYYWKYPNIGQGSRGYTSDYGYHYVDFGASNYIWSQMQDNYGTTASALLSYHCAVSVKMDFGPDGSGAFSDDAKDAFKNNFMYSNNVSIKSRYSNYTNWINLLKGELDLNRPVYYRGCEPGDGCHAWVVDGYSSGDIFHHNFGWGGFYNGYYSVANVPFFTNSQKAIVYIYPSIPMDIVLSSANTTGTYTAYNSVTMDPGFSTGTSNFVAQVHDPNKGGFVHILFKDKMIIETPINSEYTFVYPDLWDGTDASGNKAEPGEYMYRILMHDEEIETGSFIIE
jgi:hypothetical protein